MVNMVKMGIYKRFLSFLLGNSGDINIVKGFACNAKPRESDHVLSGEKMWNRLSLEHVWLDR